MMTPEEKAIELVNKYFISDIDIDWYDSIDCALIAVDEILNQVRDVAHEEIATPVTIYWLKVKQEIEKL